MLINLEAWLFVSELAGLAGALELNGEAQDNFACAVNDGCQGCLGADGT